MREATMRNRTAAIWALLILVAAAMPAADADLDKDIAERRMGTLVLKTTPGAKITVEQIRQEFWFGATLPNGTFTVRATPQDIAKLKEVFTSHFNAAVIEAAFKWHEMEPERGKVNYSTVDSMLAWASQEGLPVRGHCIFWGVPNRVQSWL
jgi:endo-1,4-beta-xylanase